MRALCVLWVVGAIVWTAALVVHIRYGDPSGGIEPPPFMVAATPTQTWPATETPAATPTEEPSRRVYRVTYYGPGFEGQPVACGSDVYGLFDPNDPTTAASGDGGPICGAHLTLCSGAEGGLCQGVVIKDGCGGCGPDHLDLSRAAWDALGQPEYVIATAASPVEPPRTSYGGDLAALAVPEGLTTRYDGCSPTYGCRTDINYYDAGARVVVLQPGEGWLKEVHELCHAHQHWAINGGADLDPSDYDLESWYASSEGVGYMVAVGVPDPWPFSHSAVDGIESFAWTCSWWYVQPGELASGCPVCYSWAEENLP